MVSKRMVLFYLVNILFVPAQSLFYQTKNNVYTIKTDAAYNFEEAKSYCQGLPYGNIAMIKDRDLATKIQKQISQQVKTGKLDILK